MKFHPFGDLYAVARKAGQHAKAVHQHSTVILAGLAAGSGFAASFVNEMDWRSATVLIVVLVGATIWFAWVTYKAPLVVEQIGAIAELERDFANTEAAARYGATFAMWASACAALVQRKMTLQRLDDAALREAVQEFLATMDKNAESLFAFDRNELWSLTVYVHDKASASLKHFDRIAPKLHPGSKRVGRTWPVGEGHVGRAWARREPLLSSDATHPDVRDAYKAPHGMTKPDDETLYRSYLSAPIGGANGGPEPFGVLVATSDKAGRFSNPAIRPIEFAANTLAAFFHLRHKRD
ncbi:MAG: GAF domain-containing protein [Tagaea sp.]|nr:GAF domain-containing protein [Tagaea sp.]